MSVNTQVERCYHEAVDLGLLQIPYVYGGDTLRGLDCSKADSWVLRAGGILPGLMGTHELMHTPLLKDGIGANMTLWVVEKPGLAHSLLEFDMPGHGRQYWAARHTGTVVGFYREGFGRAGLVSSGFRPRRRP